MEILKFQEVGVDNRENEANHNDESPTFYDEKEDRKIRENMKIISIGSRPILSANFHVQTFHHLSVSFLMFDSVDRRLLTLLLKDNFFSNIRYDPRYTSVYLF